ncbi:Spy/CpxP family protein refolding chaperone [Lichenicoccus sp.]|uniref:Spy/CpxP family protein refolding chaperone n=1 Tax=Lichenicoccus sp. TaxID=2781899 RepID=UPI003D0C98E4
MQINRTLLAACVAAALASSVGAAAQGWHAGGWHSGGAREILRAAQLTSAQQAQLHQIMHGARIQNAPALAQMQALRQQIQAMMFSTGDVTAAQIAPLEGQLETLRQQLDASRMQTGLAVRALLTPAQLARAARVQAQLASLHQQEHAIVAPYQQQ